MSLTKRPRKKLDTYIGEPVKFLWCRLSDESKREIEEHTMKAFITSRGANAHQIKEYFEELNANCT